MTVKIEADALVAAVLRRADLRARSLIVTLFGDAIVPHGSRIWVGSLIRLLAPFGITEGVARTAVLRLAREQWLSAQAAGKRSEYTLTDSSAKQFEPAERHIYALSRAPWDGRWRIVVALPGALTVSERRYLRITLGWQGFGKLGDGFFIHPSASLERALDALTLKEAPSLRARLLVLTGDPPAGRSADPRTLVHEAWDLAALSREYAGFIRRYQPLAGAPARNAAAEPAFVLRTLLVHDYRRLLLRDPELPDELLPANWHGRAAQALAAELYRSVAPASQAHLANELLTADGRHPPALPAYARRFGGAT